MVTGAVLAASVAAGVGLTVSGVVDVTSRQALLGPMLSGAVVASCVVVGALVAAARPGNLIGWLMLVGGVLWALGNAGVDVAHRGIVTAPGTVWGASAWAVGGSALRGVGWWVATVGVVMLFPDGQLATLRWRWLPRTLLAAAAVSVLGVLTASDANVTGLGSWRNPIALPAGAQPVSGLLSMAALLLAVVVGAFAVVQLWGRWRRGSAVERQQLIILACAAGLPIIAAPIVLATGAGGWVFGAAAIALPFAVGFAVLARGLYDLRTAANRTLVWLTLSLAVAGLYALVVLGVGSRFTTHGAYWVPWLAAAVVAASFAPIRDVLQRGVNRVTFGRWDERYDVLASLGQRVEASADIGRLLDDVVTELDGLGLTDVSIVDAHGAVVAGSERPGSGLVEAALSAYGQPVGALRYRSPTMSLRPRDHQLLDDLCGHLGGVLHARELTNDLHAALERLVLAREEERRRLRRDLHDGLGPALAGHLLRLDLIAATIDRTSAAAPQIDVLRQELRATVLDVRRVVEGLRPPALDELGLTGALTQVTQRLTAGAGVSVNLQITEPPVLPAAVEVAAFRIVTEAVSNVVKHAQATTCDVDITVDRGVLFIAVHDNGRGLPGDHIVNGGHGLQTMRERAEELRGRLRIINGTGTTINAELPLPPAARSVPLPTASAERP